MEKMNSVLFALKYGLLNTAGFNSLYSQKYGNVANHSAQILKGLHGKRLTFVLNYCLTIYKN
jgi:hypothetical protein